MGRDKALLESGGKRLVDRVAEAVACAAGNVTLIGDPVLYGGLGYPVLADRLPGCGPLGGICTALDASKAEWNLILACDMPGVRADFLKSLLDAAVRRGVDCLLPVGESGLPEPLCAVYRRGAARAIGQALAGGIRKITDALAGLRVELLPADDAGQFRNLNTPEDWIEYTSAQMDKTRGEEI